MAKNARLVLTNEARQVKSYYDLVDTLRKIMPTSAAQDMVDRFQHAQAERQRQWLLDEGYEPDCGHEGCSACLATEFINRIDPLSKEYQKWGMTN